MLSRAHLPLVLFSYTLTIFHVYGDGLNNTVPVAGSALTSSVAATPSASSTQSVVNDAVTVNGLSIEVFDDNGTDITSESSVFIPSTVDKIRKRSVTPVFCAGVDEDNIPYNTYTSYCARQMSNYNDQEWVCESISTGHGQLHDFHYGTCDSSEICVDGIHSNLAGTYPGQPIAYCQSLQSIVRLSLLMTSSAPSGKQIRINYGGAAGPQNAMELIMQYESDAEEHNNVVNSMDIKDQSASVSGSISNGPWTTLSENSCTSCTSLGIQPIPAGTTSWLVNTQLPAGSGTVTMYMAFI